MLRLVFSTAARRTWPKLRRGYDGRNGIGNANHKLRTCAFIIRRTTPYRSVLPVTPCHDVYVKRFFWRDEDVPARTKRENAQLKEFGANIRRERLAQNLTQQRLAELVDLNIRNLQKIEAGETNVLVTTLVRLRHALNCAADKLIPP